MADASNISPAPFDGRDGLGDAFSRGAGKHRGGGPGARPSRRHRRVSPGTGRAGWREAQRLARKALETAARNVDGIDRKWVDVVGGTSRVRIPFLVGRVC